MTGFDGSQEALQSGTGRQNVEDTEPCRWCREPFDRKQWHYPGIEHVDGGDIVVHVFCTEHCRARWEHRHRAAQAAGSDDAP